MATRSTIIPAQKRGSAREAEIAAAFQPPLRQGLIADNLADRPKPHAVTPSSDEGDRPKYPSDGLEHAPREHRGGQFDRWVKVKNRQHPAFSRVMEQF